MKQSNDGRNILVTGGYGFIGGNFIRFIRDNFPQHRIVCLDKNGYASNKKYVAGLCDKEYTFNLVDKKKLDMLFETEDKFDYIFHFAAESHVDNSIKDPSIFIQSNVVGTQNLLECFRNAKYGKMVHISTDEVYGHLGFNDPSFTESTPIDPRSPYAASKASSDLLCNAYINTFNCNISITRCCNNYGPNQHSEKFIPKIIYSLLNNQKMPVYSNGENVREWIFVDDHNAGLFKIIKDFKPDNKFNIGSGVEKTNMQVLKEVYRQLIERNLISNDFEDTYINVSDRPGHDFRYAIDSTKFKTNMFLTLYLKINSFNFFL